MPIKIIIINAFRITNWTHFIHIHIVLSLIERWESKKETINSSYSLVFNKVRWINDFDFWVDLIMRCCDCSCESNMNYISIVDFLQVFLCPFRFANFVFRIIWVLFLRSFLTLNTSLLFLSLFFIEISTFVVVIVLFVALSVFVRYRTPYESLAHTCLLYVTR